MIFSKINEPQDGASGVVLKDFTCETVYESTEDLNVREQEFFPYRDAHQGKPLPGDNEYGTWGSRFDDAKQWKLRDGQWVRVAPPKPKVEPKPEKVQAKKVKSKPPKKIKADEEPVRLLSPEPGSIDDFDPNFDLEPALVGSDRSRSPDDRASLEPDSRRVRRPPVDEDPVDIDALKDKYRPKDAGLDSPLEDETKAESEPTGVVMLEPVREPTPPMEEIKVEPITPTYVELKRPIKRDADEEKMMEDPNLLWMRMGPAQFGPPFGSLRKRKAREEEWIGPACELCHKQIEERRCMLAENMKFHCWHFACSFCLKTLKPSDYLIAAADRKPYCLNCHKREFPEISLKNLELEE